MKKISIKDINSVKLPKDVIIRCGLRTNGDIHLGNIFPIVTGFIIAKQLAAKGKNVKLVVALVDLEFVNDNEKPFVYQKDLFGCHKNLAQHSSAIILDFINKISKKFPQIKVSTHTTSSLLKDRSVREILVNCARNKNFRGLIKVICPISKQTTAAFNIIGRKVNFSCACENNQSILINKIEFAAEHDLLGVIETEYFRPDIHILGRDHVLKNKRRLSRLDYREKYTQELFNDFGRPFIFLTPLLVDNSGRKMSKTDKKGIFLSDLKKEFGKEYIDGILHFVDKNINKKRIQIKKISEIS